jgi:hypothetical protein
MGCCPHRGTTLRRRDSPRVVILTVSQIRRGGPKHLFAPSHLSASPRLCERLDIPSS